MTTMELSKVQNFCKRRMKANEGFCFLQSGEIFKIIGGIKTPNSNQNCWELKGRVLENHEKLALARIDPENNDMTPFDSQIENRITDYICTIFLPDSEIKYILVGGKL